MTDPTIDAVTSALTSVPGLTALVLGGSRARGTAGPGSDYDLGLYYAPQAPLDVVALQAALEPLVDIAGEAQVTRLGEWGPWINGGGWLSIGGRKVDLLYRDLGRVGDVIADCRAGRVSMDYQPGHPHGFCSAIWMGEVALCRPLFDRGEAVAALKQLTTPYPEALRQALIARFRWEVRFAIEIAATAIARGDQTHIAGSAYRALACVAQVLFAANRRYLINEKGALAETETLPVRIHGVVEDASAIWSAIGARDFATALDRLRTVAAALEAAVARSALQSL
ncbi:nucleotidyltransferase family protein [Phreatobacter stygius]|uniref:Nucleotidyltransferase domain-containing protein n=1 Tax=Phreatobacter stygius TaxID=1940610 RepID=A0A4D7BFN8_9HYPH|nr:nucleotidyltransferase domain-containing protein [Phreatobacter stygius]QCI66732.1 nucleotidyltransferase domain-containing protein [Phreatobacter stygius]